MGCSGSSFTTVVSHDERFFFSFSIVIENYEPSFNNSDLQSPSKFFADIASSLLSSLTITSCSHSLYIFIYIRFNEIDM